MNANITLLPGDGVGPEVVAEARKVLDTVARAGAHSFEFSEHLIGGCSIEAHGTALTDAAFDACLASDAILLGAVGGPRWDDPTAAIRPEQGLLRLRSELGLFANLRPVMIFPDLIDSSPLRPDRLAGVDVLVVRELTGGIYFGMPRLREEVDGGVRAVDTMVYSDHEIRRIVRLAFEFARHRRGIVTSVDKANILETSRLWRQTAEEVAVDFPDVELEHQLVDSAAMRLIQAPASLDVVVTTNMFGDILTDEASVLSGSLGMLPSASLGEGHIGLYEPIHGSAPDIAGQGLANPIGTILSVAMMLRSSLGLPDEAAAVERAVAAALAAGARTADLDAAIGTSTSEMGDIICQHVGAELRWERI
jgi:3-isopropylmalate dehydrogenase